MFRYFRALRDTFAIVLFIYRFGPDVDTWLSRNHDFDQVASTALNNWVNEGHLLARRHRLIADQLAQEGVITPKRAESWINKTTIGQFVTKDVTAIVNGDADTIELKIEKWYEPSFTASKATMEKVKTFDADYRHFTNAIRAVLLLLTLRRKAAGLEVTSEEPKEQD